MTQQPTPQPSIADVDYLLRAFQTNAAALASDGERPEALAIMQAIIKASMHYRGSLAFDQFCELKLWPDRKR